MKWCPELGFRCDQGFKAAAGATYVGLLLKLPLALLSLGYFKKSYVDIYGLNKSERAKIDIYTSFTEVFMNFTIL